MIGFSDANWAGDVSDRKSTSGFAFVLGGAKVSWSNRKQNCVSTSTMEVDNVALSEVAQEAVWLRRLLFGLGEEQKQPTLINEVTVAASTWYSWSVRISGASILILGTIMRRICVLKYCFS